MYQVYILSMHVTFWESCWCEEGVKGFKAAAYNSKEKGKKLWTLGLNNNFRAHSSSSKRGRKSTCHRAWEMLLFCSIVFLWVLLHFVVVIVIWSHSTLDIVGVWILMLYFCVRCWLTTPKPQPPTPTLTTYAVETPAI